jgi:inosine-uridine nucleoside N-ribohydrolase
MQKSYEEIQRILSRLRVSEQGFAFKGSDSFLRSATEPIDSPAASDLLRRAKTHTTADPLYVIAVGAPTNVSSALLRDPSLRERIVVVWLGGQPYQWPTASEFNLRQDPHASRILYDCGVPLINVPARNVSEHLRTTVSELRLYLQGKSPIADYLCSEFIKYADAHTKGPGYPYSKVIWDVATIAWLVNPKWVPSQLSPSPVLTTDLKYEMRAGRHNVRVATHVDRDAVFDDLFRKLAV